MNYPVNVQFIYDSGGQSSGAVTSVDYGDSTNIQFIFDPGDNPEYVAYSQMSAYYGPVHQTPPRISWACVEGGAAQAVGPAYSLALRIGQRILANPKLYPNLVNAARAFMNGLTGETEITGAMIAEFLAAIGGLALGPELASVIFGILTVAGLALIIYCLRGGF